MKSVSALFQMHLFLMCLALATIHALPDITPHEGALFQQQGFLIGGLSWAHITAPINISRMEQDMKGYHLLVEYFDILSKPLQTQGNRAHISDEERKRMQVLKTICQRRLEKMGQVIIDLQADLKGDFEVDAKTTKSTRIDAASHLVPSMNPVVRHRRQVVIGLAAVGGMIIGAIAGSLFSQFKTNALVDVLNKKVDTVVHQVDSLSIGLYHVDGDVKKINETLTTFERVIGKLIATDTTYEHYFAAIYSTLLLEEQADRFALAEAAIDQLLLGKLHKGLIAPTGLKTALDDLNKQAQDRGMLIGVKRPIELYQLHTSFVYDQTTKLLHAIVHIPMYRENHVLTLKRYIPIPFFSPGLNKFIQINSEQNYLAMSQDNTLIKTLNEDDLNSCLNIGHAYFCEDHSLQKSTSQNCLLHLSQGINRQELEMCLVHILPNADVIHQKSKNTYIVATSNPTTINENCQRTQNTAQKIEPGTYQIEINTNCTTSSDQWVIYPTLQIGDANINTTIVKYDFEVPSMHDDLKDDDLQAIHALIGTIGQPIPLSQMTQLIKFRQEMKRADTEYQLAHYLLSGGSTVTTMVMTMGCIVAGFFGIRYCRQRRHRRREEHDYELSPMMPAPAPPAPIIIQAPAQPAPPAQAQATTAPIPGQVVCNPIASPGGQPIAAAEIPSSPPPGLFNFLAQKGGGSLSS